MLLQHYFQFTPATNNNRTRSMAKREREISNSSVTHAAFNPHARDLFVIVTTLDKAWGVACSVLKRWYVTNHSESRSLFFFIFVPFVLTCLRKHLEVLHRNASFCRSEHLRAPARLAISFVSDSIFQALTRGSKASPQRGLCLWPPRC